MNREDVLNKVIYPTIKKANVSMPNFFMDKVDENVVFYGRPNAILDSLNLVSFVFLIEEEVENVFNKKITITTQDVLDTENPPFGSINNLVDFLTKKLNSAQ
jgi:hypothetical protein